MGHLPPKQALQFLQLVGHPVSALHVPWDGSVSPGFTTLVRKLAKGKERPVVLICRSGAGFKQVFNVEHGWRFEGLPWEQC
jgi:hypothetical protein